MNNTTLSTAGASNAGSAALVTLISYAMAAEGWTMPPEVAAAATVLIGFVAHWVVVWLKLPTTPPSATGGVK